LGSLWTKGSKYLASKGRATFGIHFALNISGGNMSFGELNKKHSQIVSLLFLAFFCLGTLSNAAEKKNPRTGRGLAKQDSKVINLDEVQNTSPTTASVDGISFLTGSGSKEATQVTGQTDTVEANGEDPEQAEERAKKSLTELVDRSNKNVETSVATTPEETKNGAFNSDDKISSLSSITFHTNNDALCLKSKDSGKPDGANCQEWLDKDVSEHGKHADSSPLERTIYSMWEGAKQKISDAAYRIWDIALKPGQSLLDDNGRLNIASLSKYELNEDARKSAEALGDKSADQALRNSLGDEAPKAGEQVSPPPEALRAIAVNITRAMANSATAKWAGIQTAKKGVEVITSVDSNSQKYQSEVQKNSNSASGEERLQAQAPLDQETQGLSLEERVAKAEALKKVQTDLANPTFEGDKVVGGDPNQERVDEWAYRATLKQLADPFSSVAETQRPKDIQLSDRQIASELPVADESQDGGSTQVKMQMQTPKDQIEAYNQQLELAAKNMEVIASEESRFVNTAEKIRSNKLKPGESILTINDLTPAQKKELNTGVTPLVQNPSIKVELPRTASQLTIQKF
jgi:hypothetical protein